MAHSYDLLQGIPADAICFSGHKMYAPSVGVIVACKQLLALLTPEFVGGGMVYEVKHDSFSLLPEPDLASRLEPGLQAFGEIIALGEAIKWLQSVKPFGMTPKAYLQLRADELYAGLLTIPSIHMLNTEARSVISFYSDEHDAHRLAIFLSGAGIMTRSGTFCCHYYLLEKKKSPPLVRLSLGLHTTKKDIDTIVDTLRRLHVKGK
jgi:cysteine desulfurase/selenocysteine lyase